MECNTNLQDFPKAMERARNPQYMGPLEKYNAHAVITGSCGDTMAFWLLVENEIITDVGFLTDGCAPSIACGSAASSLVKNKPVDEVAMIEQKDILAEIGGLPEETKHCALLAADAMRFACANYFKNAADNPNAPSNEPSGNADCEHGACASSGCSSGEQNKQVLEQNNMESRMSKIRHKIVVLSGKGGVGKSTVAANLAAALAASGKSVGILDIDIHGPSIPRMLGVAGMRAEYDGVGIAPVKAEHGLGVVSIEFFLQGDEDAVIWRGPMKMGVIKQFLSEVSWGELDYLIVDCPPGTGDEPLSIAQLLGRGTHAVIVTTPQIVAIQAVRRSINFARQLEMNILGLIENMSGYLCPECGKSSEPFGHGRGENLAKEMGVKYLGKIPISPEITISGDGGCPPAFESDSPIGKIYRDIAEKTIQSIS